MVCPHNLIREEAPAVASFPIHNYFQYSGWIHANGGEPHWRCLLILTLLPSQSSFAMKTHPKAHVTKRNDTRFKAEVVNLNSKQQISPALLTCFTIKAWSRACEETGYSPCDRQLQLDEWLASQQHSYSLLSSPSFSLPTRRVSHALLGGLTLNWHHSLRNHRWTRKIMPDQTKRRVRDQFWKTPKKQLQLNTFKV